MFQWLVLTMFSLCSSDGAMEEGREGEEREARRERGRRGGGGRRIDFSCNIVYHIIVHCRLVQKYLIKNVDF